MAAQQLTLSLEAGKILKQLSTGLLSLYKGSNQELVHSSLNKLCVRLVFCWFSDCAGLFAGKNRFSDYLASLPTSCWRWALQSLFIALDTPASQRDQDELPEVLAFPFVGGDLFRDADQDLIPQFSEELRDFILAQAEGKFAWDAISPTYFGAIFESTLNPDTRRSGGMHYTSPDNIHKLIDPLFLDELQDELNTIFALKIGKARTAKLRAFQDKLARLKFLDPACGSGNFLTEAYLCLRRLENQVIRELYAHQAFLGIIELSPVKVSLEQFAGIEINGFAVAVAKAALWIAEGQMLKETSSIIEQQLKLFPLKTYDNVVVGNALTKPWNEVVPLEQLSYIMGNPPYSGARTMSPANKHDLQQALGPDWPTNRGDLDLVSGWFKKAHDAMAQEAHIKTAFVATNSICQGTAICNLWEPLLKSGSEIIFAHRSFVWNSEASDQANVYCVIVGFANQACDFKPSKLIFDGTTVTQAAHINAYLLAAEDAFVRERSKPLSPVPEGSMGNQPLDGGYYLFTPEEKDAFLQDEPLAAPLFKRWLGGKELLQGSVRYCLYLGNCTMDELANMPEVLKRVEAVRKYRLARSSQNTVKLAATPLRFQRTNVPSCTYLALPKNSSGRRSYLPIAFLEPEVLCSDSVKLFPHATLYHFSVLSSSVHMIWISIVSGRIKMDYCYSTELVYNTFPWPQKINSTLKAQLAAAGQAILDARTPDATLAQLYDPAQMPSELRLAHAANDRLVMQAYGFDPSWSEDQIFTTLYLMYLQLINTD
ncbi:MAG: DNA methyltransferase [Anaerobiospirillum sp.]|nr:DNA methyltransferase [Anaerobiospirillum sp.]